MAVNKKLQSRRKSPQAKQEALLDISKQALTEMSHNIRGIFLVRQGLRSRSEQFMAIAANQKQAEMFCRNTLTPRYCKENEKQSLHFISGRNKKLKVIYNNDHLLIKAIDFVRTEEGRTNCNPLWYWVIAAIHIVHEIKV